MAAVCRVLCVLSATFSILSLAAPVRAAQAQAAVQPTALGYSIRSFGVLPTNPAALNTINLQKAIDWASPRGAALWVEPSDEPYALDGGLVLKRNVSLLGVHGPVGRGTKHPSKPQPVGSVFRIEDTRNAFLTVESATQVRGLQFWYPRQTLTDAAAIIAYPPTIKVSTSAPTQGVTLSSLTFYGEYAAMDFRAMRQMPCEQILIEDCYGYPLSGEFISIDYCYDVPRVLHCHVNPANQRAFRGQFSKAVVDAVIARPTFSLAIDHTDNAQLMDYFAFGIHGGIYLGAESYGQLTNFNLDCVTVGVHKMGSNSFNRNWQIAQGSIIANAGPEPGEIHPFVIEGRGHTSIVNVESFSGPNDALSTVGKSADFLLLRGSDSASVTLFGCRMRGYDAAEPLTILNPKAQVQAVACMDKNERLYNRVFGEK